jgi:hypothetical protein
MTGLTVLNLVRSIHAGLPKRHDLAARREREIEAEYDAWLLLLQRVLSASLRSYSASGRLTNYVAVGTVATASW